jgi:hypothetical protein
MAPRRPPPVDPDDVDYSQFITRVVDPNSNIDYSRFFNTARPAAWGSWASPTTQGALGQALDQGDPNIWRPTTQPTRPWPLSPEEMVVPSRDPMGEVGGGALRTAQDVTGAAGSGLAKDIADVFTPPQYLTEQERWNRMGTVAGASPEELGATAWKGIQAAAKAAPKTVAAGLGALGFLASGGETATEAEAAPRQREQQPWEAAGVSRAVWDSMSTRAQNNLLIEAGKRAQDAAAVERSMPDADTLNKLGLTQNDWRNMQPDQRGSALSKLSEQERQAAMPLREQPRCFGVPFPMLIG